MNRSFRIRVPLDLCGFCLAFFLARPAPAFHGLLPVAYGARAAGMGGAVTALGGSALDLTVNPAHLARNSDYLDLSLAANFARLEYDDRYIDAKSGVAYESARRAHPVAPFPAMAYSNGSGRFGWGVALYLVGGGGGEFNDLPRAPAADRATASENLLLSESIRFRFMLAKLSPGVAVALTERLRLGVAFDIAYARQFLDRELRDAARTRTLPGGVHYRSDPAVAPGFKVGALYRFRSNLHLGYAYESALRLPLDGDLFVDSNQIQLPQRARVSRDLGWPDRHSAGFAWSADRLTLSFDVRFTPWSSHFRSMRFVLAENRVALPLGVNSNQFVMNLRWRDQWVYGAGLEYDFDRLQLRGGYSYGRSPISARGASPFLGATTEHHLSAGLSVKAGAGRIHFAVERAFARRLQGAPLADWWLSRALVNDGAEIRFANFEFSRDTSVWMLAVGWQGEWENS